MANFKTLLKANFDKGRRELRTVARCPLRASLFNV